jgi:hypothetical protein
MPDAIKIRIRLENPVDWEKDIVQHMVRMSSSTLCNLIDDAVRSKKFAMPKTRAKNSVAYDRRYRQGSNGGASAEFETLVHALLSSLTPAKIINALLQERYAADYIYITAVDGI